MTGESMMTIIGQLTADPELRYTPSGTAVVSFTVASTPRVFDRANERWCDGQTLYLRCSMFRQPAENAAESFTRGTRVVVYGKVTQRSFETREGDKRTIIEIVVEEVGASVKYATVAIAKRTATWSESESDAEARAIPWADSEPTGDPDQTLSDQTVAADSEQP